MAEREDGPQDPTDSAHQRPFPRFRYHPDPLATGAFERSNVECECCGRARGYVYTAAVYTDQEIESVCPWCIADGSVHAKFGATLNDDHPLLSAGIPIEVAEEVTQRTPGYVSWQQDSWICCCGDACEFHGDAPRSELQGLGLEDMSALSRSSGFPVDELPSIVANYELGGSPAFYKFVCRHCRKVTYNGDCD